MKTYRYFREYRRCGYSVFNALRLARIRARYA